MAGKSQVSKYFEALQRLKERGATINNDTVALEAGSGRGSIKKSRPAYAELIAAIDLAAQEQTEAKSAKDPAPGLRQELARLQAQLDNALEREAALFFEVQNLRAELRQLKKGRLLAVQ